MPDITVYTQSGCVTSQLWLEMLRDRGIPYTQKRIDSDPAAADELRRHGSLATPTTLVEGRVLTGFHRSRLAELIELAGPAEAAGSAAPAEAAPAEAAPAEAAPAEAGQPEAGQPEAAASPE